MQEILKEVISWAVPIICTGIMACALRPFKKAQKQNDKGKALMEQEEWDSHSNGLLNKINNRLISDNWNKYFEGEMWEFKNSLTWGP